MSVLRDCEALNAAIDSGRAYVDVRHRERVVKTKGRQYTPVNPKKCSRCPTCGGLVILPCLLCSLEEL